MNIKNLDISVIEELSYIYSFAEIKFNKKMETKNIKIQNKIRKWIYKNHIIDSDFSEDVLNQLKNLSYDEFISFLKSCYDYIDINGNILTQQINETCKDFPDSVKKAFINLFDHEYYVNDDFRYFDNTLEITVYSSVSYEQKLILFDAKFSVDKKYDSFCFIENCSLIKENDIYKLTGEASNDVEEEYFDLSITFTSAKTEIEFFNPINSFIEETPWDQLITLSILITAKEDFENSFNDSEIKIMSLLNEIKNLSFIFNDKVESFIELKALLSKHKYFKLLPLIEKIESKEITQKRRANLSLKLIRKLNLLKYKNLWQEIYDLISDSQKKYSTYIHAKKPKVTITKLKNKVNSIMQEHGYIGEFPEYYKHSALKGIHFIESYYNIYTVMSEKNVNHYIYCKENIDSENRIYLTFTYGSEFLKRRESMSDINSCRFDCKGRKYISSIQFNGDFEDSKRVSLEEKIKIVTKKAEFKKLNKEEKSKIFNIFGSFFDKFKLFIFTFVFFGFLFATGYILCMMAVDALWSWIDGVPMTFNVSYWIIMYFILWILSGIPMAIVTLLSKK